MKIKEKFLVIKQNRVQRTLIITGLFIYSVFWYLFIEFQNSLLGTITGGAIYAHDFRKEGVHTIVASIPLVIFCLIMGWFRHRKIWKYIWYGAGLCILLVSFAVGISTYNSYSSYPNIRSPDTQECTLTYLLSCFK